jgi:hypothetical protein
MLIKIHSSRLFDTNPAVRFAEQYNVPQELWTELWKRHQLLDYSIIDLADYFHLKAGKPIKRRYIKKWIFLTEVYNMAKPARDMGAQVINTELFGELEPRVIEEVTRNMRFSGIKSSNIMA